MTKKLTKSIQVRLTENEWKLVKKLTNNNPSEYLRNLLLRRVNKPIAVTIKCAQQEGVSLEGILAIFERQFGDYINLDTLKSVPKRKDSRFQWAFKIEKSLLPDLLAITNQYDYMDVSYRKDSL